MFQERIVENTKHDGKAIHKTFRFLEVSERLIVSSCARNNAFPRDSHLTSEGSRQFT